MDSDKRTVCGICGALIIVGGLACLGVLAFRAHRRVRLVAFDSEDRWDEFVEMMTNTRNPNLPAVHLLYGVGVLIIGAFLCVKAVFGPPRFWAHTTPHLLMASAVAWALTAAML